MRETYYYFGTVFHYKPNATNAPEEYFMLCYDGRGNAGLLSLVTGKPWFRMEKVENTDLVMEEELIKIIGKGLYRLFTEIEGNPIFKGGLGQMRKASRREQ